MQTTTMPTRGGLPRVIRLRFVLLLLWTAERLSDAADRMIKREGGRQ
jgi:hypothetical protein